MCGKSGCLRQRDRGKAATIIVFFPVAGAPIAEKQILVGIGIKIDRTKRAYTGLLEAAQDVSLQVEQMPARLSIGAKQYHGPGVVFDERVGEIRANLIRTLCNTRTDGRPYATPRGAEVFHCRHGVSDHAVQSAVRMPNATPGVRVTIASASGRFARIGAGSVSVTTSALWT